MSTHRITSKIEGDLVARTLLLEGTVVDLSPDGSGAFGATNTIEVIGGLNIACIVRSLASNTDWKLTVSEGSNILVSEARTIVIGNRDSFATTVNLPEPAAGASKSLLAGDGAKKGGAKKGGAKKGGAKKGEAAKSGDKGGE